jgi:hypothetical protein
LSDPSALEIFCVPVATLVREVRLVDCHLQPAGCWYLMPQLRGCAEIHVLE